MAVNVGFRFYVARGFVDNFLPRKTVFRNLICLGIFFDVPNLASFPRLVIFPSLRAIIIRSLLRLTIFLVIEPLISAFVGLMVWPTTVIADNVVNFPFDFHLWKTWEAPIPITHCFSVPLLSACFTCRSCGCFVCFMPIKVTIVPRYRFLDPTRVFVNVFH